MFDGIGIIVLIVVMRVLVARAWRRGIGLTLSRRLAIPVAALAIGLFTLRGSFATVFGFPLIGAVAAGLTITGTAAIVRANTAHYSLVSERNEYPGGVCIQARPITLTADILGAVVAAALTFGFIAPSAGIAAAGGSLTVIVALGDMIASILLVLRGRPASLPDAARASRTETA